MSKPTNELTYGEKAVGISFNPSNDSDVHQVKTKYAELINKLDATRAMSDSAEQKRLCSIAITEAQTAQMWAVKAITWRD
ncbi:MAG: hypothetical protein [Podoviridae sp. ctrTa16]|nr:MAG: hypothetical protein [Podoviridae sp. ctrTa16]